MSWGDYDNDGDLDIALSGLSTSDITRLYRNDSDNFAEMPDRFPAVSNGSLSWGDFEDDGDLDLAFTGEDYFSAVYKSLVADHGIANTGPQAPSPPVAGFISSYSTSTLKLSLRWDKSNDNGIGATAVNGLYYEIRVATQSITDSVQRWIVSPSIGLGVGSSPSQLLGSYPHGYCDPAALQPGFDLNNPHNGTTYYWQVRTMDAGLRKSAWSVEQSTYVPLDSIPPGQVNDFTAVNGLQVLLSWTAPGDDRYVGDVKNGMWRIDYSSVTETPGETGGASVRTRYVPASFVSNAPCEFSMDGLVSHILYYFQVKARDDAGGWCTQWSSSASAVAGAFGNNNAGLTGVEDSFLCWGDYDNDGDLDLAVAGENWDLSPAYVSRVYRNDGGNFVNATGDSISGVSACSLSWGDYDNDGDLDLALAGWSDSRPSRVYRNDGGNFINATGDSLTGVYYCSLGWGDYDNDGDLDLALAGSSSSRVYRNDADSFINAIGTSVTGVSYCSLSWGDYDNDGDLDLALAGYGGTYLSRVYRNDGGNFVNATGDTIAGVYRCSLSWGDYDNDGDLDLALAGSGGSYISCVYRNDTSGFVNATGDSITGVGYCSLSWGDYDNDGDLDLALLGADDGWTARSRVYRNDACTFVNATGDSITGVDSGSLSWGDYDNDGDLDLALTGDSGSGLLSRIYRSFEADSGNVNTVPAPPVGMTAQLQYAAARSTITFSWDPGQYDTGRSAHSLYYQIAVSTQPTAWDGTKFTGTPHFTMPWQNGSPLMGTHVRPAARVWPGDSAEKHELFLTGDNTLLQAETTYYWRVQTIDAGLRRSAWSAEYTICTSVNDTTPPAAISDLTALPGKDAAVRLMWTSPGDDETNGTLENGLFRIKYSSVAIITAAAFDAPPPDYSVQTIDISTRATPGTIQTLTLTQLTLGTTYWFAIRTMDNAGHWSVWKSSADVASVNTLAWRAVKLSYPAAVTDLAVSPGAAEGTVALTWTSPHEYFDDTGGSVSRYIVKHATFSAASLSGGATAWWAHTGLMTGLIMTAASINVPGATESGIVAALAPGVTYYFGIVSEDAFAGLSDIDVRAYTAQATAAARDLPPDPPTGLAAVSVSTYSISLAWDIMSGCTGYMDFSYYALYRSTAGAAMALVSTTTFTVYVDTAVIVETTYYYQLNAVDSGPSVLSGGMGPILAVCMPAAPVFNSAVPRAPSGIKLESTRSVRTIRWSPVRYNSDGTPSTNLARYAVYRSNDPRGGWTLAGTTDTCAWNDTTPITGTWYYTVRAVTTDGVESADSLLCDTAFNILAISDDSRVLLTIPSTVASPLYQGQVCDEDVTVVVAPLDAQPGLTAVAVYELTALNAQTDEEVAAFRFAKTRAKLTYFCQDAAAPQDADDLAFSWFNGVEWIRVGTEQEGASIVTMTSRLGTYAVRETMRATTFTLYSVYPRTFTPNGDNRNDHVEFQYDNPRDAFVVGKIYDKAGALVTELREGIQMDSLMWDGTTSKGTRARPGAYVYQIEVTGSESKVINGIVVVAR